MIIKAVTFFLIFIIALGIFGKLRWFAKITGMSRKSVTAARKCPACGTIVPGQGACPCGKGG